MVEKKATKKTAAAKKTATATKKAPVAKTLSVNIYNNFFHIKSSKKRSAPQFYGLHCV